MKQKTLSSALIKSLVGACILITLTSAQGEIAYNLEGATLTIDDSNISGELRVEISADSNFSPIVSHYAGVALSAGTTDGERNGALFNTPSGIARDSEGNLFVADTVNHLIRMVDTTGVVSTIAGSRAGFSDGGGAIARFRFPTAIAVGNDGDLYVADSFNHAIRKIARTDSGGNWTVTTLAGTGSAGYFDGVGVVARFNRPQGIALDALDNVYVADSGNHLIRLVDTSGTVSTFAGKVDPDTGTGSSGHDDGTTADATFNYPLGLAFDQSEPPTNDLGDLYVADRNNRVIRRIDLRGPGTEDVVETIGPSPADDTAPLNSPVAVAVYGRAIYVCDKQGQTIEKILLDQNGSFVERTTLAGMGLPINPAITSYRNGLGSIASFNCPSGICTDDDGNFYVADTSNHLIRRIVVSGLTVPAEANGSIFTANISHASLGLDTHSVSSPKPYYFRWIAEDNSIVRATSLTPLALFDPPFVEITPADNNIDPNAPVTFTTPDGTPSPSYATLYADVDTAESATTVTFEYSTDPDLLGPLEVGEITGNNLATLVEDPGGITEDPEGNLYLSDRGNHSIFKLSPTDSPSSFEATLLAGGSGTAGFSDGLGENARFDHPGGLAYDPSDGSLYVADEWNHRIRRVSHDGQVTTVAGSGIAGFADANDAAAGEFLFPTDLAFSGNILYVADRGNHSIRAIEATISDIAQRSIGRLITFAGNGNSGFADEAALSAEFNNPSALAISSAGIVLVADRGNHRVRAINPTTGFVSTRAGTGDAGYLDGDGSIAQFSSPCGLAIDANDNLFVADEDNHRIRLVNPAGATSTHAGSGTPGRISNDPLQLFPATASAFNRPRSLLLSTASATSTLYVAESDTSVLRRITRGPLPTGHVYLPEEGDLEPGEIGYSSLSTETYSIQQELLPSATYYFRVRAQNGRTETVSDISSFTMPGAQNLVLLADIFPTTPLPDDQTTVIDFGTTPLGVVVSQGFTLTNDGEWPLLVSSLSVSTGYVISSPPNLPTEIGEGESLDFAVTLLSTAGAVYEGSLKVDSDDPDIPRLEIPLSGTVLDPPSVTTLSAAEPTETTALLRAQINPSGTPTDTWFAYSLDEQLDGVDVSTLPLVTENSSPLPQEPRGLVIDSSGDLYVADPSLHQILRLSPDLQTNDWIVTSIAGDGIAGFADGPAATARFNQPTDLAIGADGSIYVADSENNRIRVIAPDRTVRTLAGTGVASFTDGDPRAARFNRPTGIAIDASGLLYVADYHNHRIRTVASDGTTATLAGGAIGDNTTNGDASTAILISPHSLAVAPDSTVYFTEYNRNHIRKVSGGAVSTLAGDEVDAGSTDGNGSAARFSHPRRLAIDASGNILVAEERNSLIRLVQPDGLVTIIAGSGQGLASADGVGNTVGMSASSLALVSQADFRSPFAIAGSPDGTILVGESASGLIRRITSNTIIVGAATADGTTELTGANTVNVTGLATGLIPRATYFTRAYARNSGGATTGNSQSFTSRNLTRFEAWQVHHFGSTEAADAASDADPDGDGEVNLCEYALLSDPANIMSTPELDGTLDYFSITGRIYVKFIRDINSVYGDVQNSPEDGDLIFTIMGSDDGVTWSPVSNVTLQTGPLPKNIILPDSLQPNIRAEQVYASIPLSTEASPDANMGTSPSCLRVRVTLVPLP